MIQCLSSDLMWNESNPIPFSHSGKQLGRMIVRSVSLGCDAGFAARKCVY